MDKTAVLDILKTKFGHSRFRSDEQKKANILYLHDTCETNIKVDECNVLIILKDGNSTEYTVVKGMVVSIEHGNITLNKGPEVVLKSYDPTTDSLLEGEDAAKEFTNDRHQGGAKLNNIEAS